MNKSVRRLASGIAGMILVLALTGCGSDYPELTAEQEQAIGEYAAMTLLKYDAENRSRLVDASVVEAYELKVQQKKEQAAAQATPEPAPEATMKPTADTPVIDVEGEAVVQVPEISLEESLDAPEGVSVSYRGYKLCNTYPEDGSAEGFFALDAEAGQKLLVLEFLLTNETAAEKTVDFFSAQSVYRIKVGDAEPKNAMTTLLWDDLSTYAGKLPASGTEEVVLVFEVADNVSKDDIKLYYKNESNEYTIPLND